MKKNKDNNLQVYIYYNNIKKKLQVNNNKQFKNYNNLKKQHMNK